MFVEGVEVEVRYDAQMVFSWGPLSDDFLTGDTMSC